MKCEYCDKEIEISKKTETKSGHYFCSYECFEDFFGGEINEDDDFKEVA